MLIRPLYLLKFFLKPNTIHWLVKKRVHQGLDPNIYFYRDSNLNEVDVVQKQAPATLFLK